MNNTHTIAELEALPDDDLSALAAELRGWHFADGLLWLDNTSLGLDWKYKPATNHNQSRELMAWAATQYSVRFCTITGMGIYSGITQIDEHGYEPWGEIPGTSARSETVAFCAAMLAQQGRLK